MDEINYCFGKKFAHLTVIIQRICSSPILSNTSPRSYSFPLSALPSNKSLRKCATLLSPHFLWLGLLLSS